MEEQTGTCDAPLPSAAGTPDPGSPTPVGPSSERAESSASSVSSESSERPQGKEWTAPRRIALIVAFAISLALFFGTAAGLFEVPNALPVAPALALLGGIAELPALLLYVAGFERRVVRWAPLLILSSACGLESYFIGGTIGVGSPSTLGAAAITIVLFLMLGHRAKESHRRRVKRVRRWGRNAAILGAVLVLVALALYGSYVSTPPLPSIASGTLSQGTELLPGHHVYANGSLTGSSGDLLFVLLGTSNTNVAVTATILNSGGVPMANLTAGNLSTPNVVFLELKVDPGTYGLLIAYPSVAGGPAVEEVRWSAGVIPAGVQAETGAALSSGWVGFALFVIGVTLWVVARPPEEATPTAATSSGLPPTAEAGTKEPEAPGSLPSSAGPEPSQESSTRSSGVGAETSDKGRT